MASTQLGDAPRIENTGSTSWKPLRSSSGHALDDDDDTLTAFIFILPFVFFAHVPNLKATMT